MRIKVGGLAAVILWALCVLPAGGGDLSASDALLPVSLTMETTYQPGPGEPVGKVTAVRGEAVIVHADRRKGYLAEVTFALYPGDLVVTREKGRLTIALNDGSSIALSAVTRLVIDRSVYDPAAKSRESLFRMGLGKARFWVKKIADAKRSSSFRVKTGTAIAGVRGSDFVIVSTAGQTEITALQNTRLEVVGLSAPDKVVILTDYQRTVVAAGRVPTAPVAVTPVEIEELIESLNLGGGSDLSKGSTLVNTLSGKNLTNKAVGEGSEANLGTIRLKGASVSGAVVNQARAKQVTNLATGNNAAATLGTVKIGASTVTGTVINQTDAQNVTNIAEGSGSEANVGAIVVE